MCLMPQIQSRHEYDNAKLKDRVTLRCVQCGNIFKEPKATVQTALKGKSHNKAIYCSLKCYGAAHDKREEVECETCGEKFFKKANQIRKTRSHFCGRECYYRFKRGLISMIPRNQEPEKTKIYLIARAIDEQWEVGEDTPEIETKARKLAEEKRLELGCKIEVYSLGENIPGRGCIYETKGIRHGYKPERP